MFGTQIGLLGRPFWSLDGRKRAFYNGHARVKVVAEEHDSCTRAPVPLVGGPGIRSLPDHVSVFPWGRNLRLLRLRCGVFLLMPMVAVVPQH